MTDAVVRKDCPSTALRAVPLPSNSRGGKGATGSLLSSPGFPGEGDHAKRGGGALFGPIPLYSQKASTLAISPAIPIY